MSINLMLNGSRSRARGRGVGHGDGREVHGGQAVLQLGAPCPVGSINGAVGGVVAGANIQEPLGICARGEQIGHLLVIDGVRQRLVIRFRVKKSNVQYGVVCLAELILRA